MVDVQAELLVECQNVLGEGVQWHAAQQRLYWTDIANARLYSCDEFGNHLEISDLTERLCAFAFSADDTILAAFASGFYRFDPASGARDRLAAFEDGQPGTRLNDGRCDRQGRFVCGGYDEGGEQPTTSVVVYDGAAPRTLITGVTCANSIAFSGDGRRMYFADSYTKDIVAYDYDAKAGAVSNREVFATLRTDEGAPDGSTVDANDALWNAQYGGSCVQQFHADGTRGARVSVPAPHVTCACFGGAKLDKLFITTARENLNEEQLARFPLSGGVFVARPGAVGLAESGYKDRLFA